MWLTTCDLHADKKDLAHNTWLGNIWESEVWSSHIHKGRDVYMPELKEKHWLVVHAPPRKTLGNEFMGSTYV